MTTWKDTKNNHPENGKTYLVSYHSNMGFPIVATATYHIDCFGIQAEWWIDTQQGGVTVKAERIEAFMELPKAYEATNA